MSHNKTPFYLLYTLFFMLFLSCSSNEIGESKDVEQNKIYQDYSIRYSESNNYADIYCQFRFGGINGTTLVLNQPSEVRFDGEKLKVDSNKMSGAFYKVSKPIVGFFGPHQIEFTDIDQKKYATGFAMDSFTLIAPAVADKNKSLSLTINPSILNKDDYIEIRTQNTDSSFTIFHYTNEGREIINIPKEQLLRQKSITLTLEATLHKDIPLQGNTAEGGRIGLSYTIKPFTVKLQ